MYKFKNKRLLLAGLGLLSLSTVVGSVALSSCTSSSTTPYAPYTALVMNNTTSNGDSTSTSSVTYRYQTSNKTVSYYNTGSLFGTDNQNKYLTLTNVKDYYYAQSKLLTESVLTESNWSTLKSLYGESSSSVELSSYTTRPNFFYGAAPTSTLVSIAKIYNQMSVMSSVFQYAATLSNTLLSYLVADSIGPLFNTSIQDLIGLSTQLGSNEQAKELLAGNAFTFGVGNNIYQLWPTGIEADITFPDEMNTSNSNAGSTLMTAENTQANDINAPYNIATYNSSNSSTSLPTISSQKVKVTNIKITYQWYKTGRTGGSYITDINLVNSATTADQKAVLAKMGLTIDDTSDTGYVGSLAYSLPISDLTFDVIPETYSYQDPFYAGLYNTVTTGLWNVKTPMTLSTSNSVTFTELYPNEMKITIGNSTSVNWKGIVSVSSMSQLKNSLPSTLYESISSKKLSTLPYYQTNLSYTNNTDVVPYAITSTSLNINAYNFKQALSLFSDPFNKSSSTLYYNQPVYNNINNLTKQNYLNLWALGYLASKGDTNVDILSDSEYKSMKSQLNFSNNQTSVPSDLLTNSYYTSGKTAFFNLIKLSETTESKGYQFTSTSIISPSSFLAIFEKKEN